MSIKQEEYTAEQKLEQVLQFISSRKSLPDYCRQYGIPERDFRAWRKQFMRGGRDSLRYGGISTEDYRRRIQYLESKIERLELDNITLRTTVRFMRENVSK